MTHWLAELDGRRISVEVPASSANLGAGYDCLGLALSIFDRIDLEVRGWSRGSIELTVEGEGASELAGDRTNRFVLGLEAVLAESRGPLPDGVGWRIDMHNDIPLTRGLGSSAAATVGGVLAGNALLGEPLTTPDLLRIASAIEGHPDNAAAALLGGFTVASRIGVEPDSPIEALRFDAPRELRAVLFIPEMRLSTADMRRTLPAKIPLADAVGNIGRVALGVAGLATGRHDLLRSVDSPRMLDICCYLEPHKAIHLLRWYG